MDETKYSFLINKKVKIFLTANNKSLYYEGILLDISNGQILLDDRIKGRIFLPLLFCSIQGGQ